MSWCDLMPVILCNSRHLSTVFDANTIIQWREWNGPEFILADDTLPFSSMYLVKDEVMIIYGGMAWYCDSTVSLHISSNLNTAI